MNETDLRRVREDLETMKQAAGLRLPFGRADVWLNATLIPAGLFLSAWAFLAPWRYVLLGLIPILLGAAGYVGLWMYSRRGENQSPARRREYGKGLIFAVLLFVLMEGYLQWEKQIGMPREFTGAAAVFSSGVACAALAVMDRRRLSYVGAAIPLMLFGIAIPLCTPRQLVMIGGLAVAVAGAVSAAIQTWQLQSQGRKNDPTTD